VARFVAFATVVLGAAALARPDPTDDALIIRSAHGVEVSVQ
jgi:hypothetical protein